jgi:hypothetical protein
VISLSRSRERAGARADGRPRPALTPRPLPRTGGGALLLAFALAAGQAHAQDRVVEEAAAVRPPVSVPSAHARFSFERVRFPGDDRRVGLAGATYLVDIGSADGWTRGLSVGPGVYGAVTGRHGGFFALGGELAWRQRLAGPLGVELGAFAGGGGGGGAPAGSGFVFRPHADLLWDFGGVALGLSVSRLEVSGGRIGSTQVGLVLNASDAFRFVPAARLDEPQVGRGRAGLGFDRVQFTGGVYRARRAALDDGSGRTLPRSIPYFGVRAEQSVARDFFWGLEANRATRGDVGGYAEVLGTVGYETEAIRDTLTLGARLAVGAAGGGGVPTGGGFLAKAGVHGIVRLGGDLGLALEGGVATAPKGDLRAGYASASLVWALDGPGGIGRAARPARTDFSVGAQRFDAPRGDGTERSLALATLRVDRYLAGGLYVGGQAMGAVGGNASGFSGALVGVGYEQRLGGRFAVGGELFAGAAGGGGVDASGALLQPRLWAGVQFTPALGLRVGVARPTATRGPLGATAFDASLVFTYGVLAGD